MVNNLLKAIKLANYDNQKSLDVEVKDLVLLREEIIACRIKLMEQSSIINRAERRIKSAEENIFKYMSNPQRKLNEYV